MADKPHPTGVCHELTSSGLNGFPDSRYYKTAILSGETDTNELYKLEVAVKECGLFSDNEEKELVKLYCFLGAMLPYANAQCERLCDS